ncbi:MAG: hypothetical protein GX649_17900 [Chloroflexi bacterium]|nr:hypothetical protein [Chloroflexota bacterium]
MPDMPTVPFGPHRVSRLIIGGNPFSGNSHYSPALNEEMADYFTADRIVRTLLRCQSLGMRTVQTRADRHLMRVLREYRNAGGTMDWIAQTASELADLEGNVRQIAAQGAIGAYHHGSRTDRLWAEGRIDDVLPLLQCMRDEGLQVGVGTHIPEVIDYIEERGWDVDFYMACLYNLNRKPRDGAIVAGGMAGEQDLFHDEDREAMARRILATDKTVLAFKLLAANRKTATPADRREAFRWAFAHIKPGDAVVVGMFPKYGDQVRENVGYTLEFGAV